jgi:hypothetical protein
VVRLAREVGIAVPTHEAVYHCLLLQELRARGRLTFRSEVPQGQSSSTARPRSAAQLALGRLLPLRRGGGSRSSGIRKTPLLRHSSAIS